MSTRANVIITETRTWGGEKHTESLVFYRHSDGYPDGTMPALELFLDWVKSGCIRDNVDQSAGWLIMIGAIEYGTIPKYEIEEGGMREYGDLSTIAMPIDNGSTWKAGAFEPATVLGGDIEYLYVVDLTKKTIKVYETQKDFDRIEKKLLGLKYLRTPA